MNMKKVMKIIAVGALLASAAVHGFAATNGTLFLSGVVAPISSIVVNADPNAASLPVGATVNDLVIAKVHELSNNKAGYTVTISSANGGSLVEADTQGSDSLPYTLTYGGNPVDLGSGPTIVSSVSARTSAAGNTQDLAISFSEAFLNADTYTDVLTFTIASN